MAKATGNRRKPALDPDARERQLIALAIDRAEEQLRDGTASSQVITHFLKLGCTRAQLEKEKLELENNLTRVKTSSIEAQQNSEKLYADAIAAFGIYSGDEDDY